MIHHVIVGVALSRPPAVHQIRRYRVEAADETEAQLIATQMAACTSVMPVWSSTYFDVPDGWCADVPGVHEEETG